MSAVEWLKGTRQSVKLLAQLRQSVASHKLNLGLFAAQLYSTICKANFNYNALLFR